MGIITILLAIGFLLIHGLPFIIGSIGTPPGFMFLGTVHHPQDYFLYISEFIQGIQGRWASSFDLYTSDFLATTFVGWINVTFGRLLSLFTSNPIIAYQIALTLSLLLVFWVTLLFLQSVFPGKAYLGVRILTLAFFLFNNPFPIISRVSDQWALTFRTYWFNLGETWVRFPGVPHQVLGTASIIATFLLATYHPSSPTKRVASYIILALCGLLVASVNPVQWVIVCVTLAIVGVNMSLVSFALGGLPMALYLARIFRVPPFNQSALWRIGVQGEPDALTILAASGPAVLLGIVGLPQFLSKKNAAQRALFFYTLISTLLFFSPIPSWTGMSNFRVVSSVTILGFTAAASLFLFSLLTSQRRLTKTIGAVLLSATLLLPLPTFLKQFETRMTFDKGNSYLYLSHLALEAYKETKRVGTSRDVFLVTWPFDVSFSALTGLRSFMGHPLWTMNAEEKNRLATAFFGKSMSPANMHAFLRNNGITYVLAFQTTFPTPPAFLSPVLHNAMVTLFKVL